MANTEWRTQSRVRSCLFTTGPWKSKYQNSRSYKSKKITCITCPPIEEENDYDNVTWSLKDGSASQKSEINNAISGQKNICGLQEFWLNDLDIDNHWWFKKLEKAGCHLA